MGAVKSVCIPNMELNGHTMDAFFRPFLDPRIQSSVADQIKTEANDPGCQSPKLCSKAKPRLSLINRAIGQSPFKRLVNK